MKIELLVRVDGRNFNGGACIEVPELLVRSFEPLQTSDCMFGTALGEPHRSSVQIETRLELRDQAASKLAGSLAALIVNEMSKLDTHNGYERMR